MTLKVNTATLVEKTRADFVVVIERDNHCKAGIY